MSSHQLCEYSGRCEFFSKASETCRHGGGPYCGEYRKLELEKPLVRG
jgi:hypothetical protein